MSADVSEPVVSDRPGRCEVDGCGRLALFRDERRCAWHPAVTRVVVRLADGQVIETAPPPEAA